MRVALCLYGQPRFFEAGYRYLKRNLMDPNSGGVDVFAHAWYDKTKIGTEYDSVPWLASGRAGKVIDEVDSKIENLYRPIRSLYEPQKTFQLNRDYGAFCTKTPPVALFSCFYSQMISNGLREEHERKTGILYDWVVFTRYDYALMTPLKLNQMDSSVYNIAEDIQHNDENKHQANNNLIWSSSENMSKYGGLFHKMDAYWKDDGVRMGGECMCGWHIHKCGKRQHHNIKYAFIREYGAGTNEINVGDCLT